MVKEDKKPKNETLNFHHGNMPFFTWHLNVGTDLCYLPFSSCDAVMYMLLVYNQKYHSHDITILIFSQFLLFFSSHNKKLARKYPCFGSFGSKMKMIN